LDLVVLGLEKLDRGAGQNNKGPWILQKSTVRLNYIVVVNDVGKLAQALHFDFDENGQADHPFFHAQLTDEPISAEECLTGHLDFELQSSADRNDCHLTVRIPTCDMTLHSVLYCLAADHFGGPIFSQFAKKVDAMHDRLPPLRFDALRESVATSPKHLKSIHWFAHMRASVNAAVGSD
jgi:hypothetical protein